MVVFDGTDTFGKLGTGPGETDYVKRVIGLPGDHVVCCDATGHLTVNGRALDERAYLYPGDNKHPDGKLRLLYEANPLAFMVEQAGGAASDGRQRILEKVPSGLHQRTPLVIGSTEDVALYGEFVAGKR